MATQTWKATQRDSPRVPTRPPAPFPGKASPPGGRPSYPACAFECQIRQETDHRVANQLAMLAGYVRLKGAELDGSGPVNSASIRLLTRSIEAQIHAVARLHRLLMSHGSADAVDIAPLLHEMCASFRSGVERPATLVDDLAPDCPVTTDQVLPICQLVGEAIINAMKYAHSASADDILVVRLQRTDLGAIAIDVIDNGPGLPAGFDPERDGGFGFRLMRGVCRTLGAQLAVHSAPDGVRIGVVLPSGGS